MTITPDSLRRDLAAGAAASVKADRAGGEIRKAAAERREAVRARLSALSNSVITESGAADEYQALIRERGELDLVLAHG